MPYDPIRLGQNVKAAREAARMTRWEFADHAAVLEVNIREIEFGYRDSDPRLSTLCKIARAAGVTLAELLEGVDT